MGFFDRREVISLEDFCRKFYDEFIFNPLPKLGPEVLTVFPELIKKSLSEADKRFADIDIQKLADELIAIRIELLALAFAHKFGEKLAIAQSIFTKKYLQEKNKIKLWDAMETYNKFLAEATRAHAGTREAQIIKFRYDLAKKYIPVFNEKGIEVDERLGRPINRLYSESAWAKGHTNFFLILALTGRIAFKGVEPNNEAQFRINGFLYGFYNGAIEAIEEVKIKQ